MGQHFSGHCVIGKVKLTSVNRLLQELNSLLLASIAVALLVVEPSQLLQDLGVVGVPIEHTPVGGLGRLKVFLLLVNVTNLEPDVFLGERTRRVVDDVFEALQTLAELLLLFVDDSETEINLVGLFKFGSHAHDLRESFLGMVEGAIAIIQDADAVPQLRFLGVAQVIEGLLIGSVGLLQVIHH